MRLIDADKFIKWLDIGHLRHPSELCFSELNVETMIKLQPTIDPETLPEVIALKKQLAEVTAERDEFMAKSRPVVYGEWLDHYQSGQAVGSGAVSSCCDMWNERKSNFCPNCGADMRGENK